MVFLCTLPGALCTMDNIEEIHLPLDHMPDQYLPSYFSLPRKVCDDQHDNKHQVGEPFFLTEEYEMYYIIYINS